MPVKTWKVKEDAKTGIQIGEDFILGVVGNGDSTGVGFHITEKANHIQGPVHFLDPPEAHSYGAMFKPTSGFRQIFPSNLAFPNPAMKLEIQIMRTIEHMIKSVQWMSMGLV
jgi:hypothetical protein